jgi:GH35 family endo-1,4-beta-xylanase
MPLDQFEVAKSELEFTTGIGETGILMVPVETVGENKENYIFRKHSRITPEGEFKPESVKDMRKKIGVVTDLETPLSGE